MPNERVSLGDTRALLRLAGDLHDLRDEPSKAWSHLARGLAELVGARSIAVGHRSSRPGSAMEPWSVRGRYGFLDADEDLTVAQAREQPGFVWEATERMLALEDEIAVLGRDALVPPGSRGVSGPYLGLLAELDWGDMLISKRPGDPGRAAWLCVIRPDDGSVFGDRERTLVALAHRWVCGTRSAWAGAAPTRRLPL